MPDATFACTMFFNHQTDGWSETYYREAPGPQEALTQLDLLAARRQALLTSPARINYLRVSDVEVRGDAAVRRVNLVGQPYVGGPDLPWTGIECRFEAGGDVRRVQPLRGAPDLATRVGLTGKPSQTFPAFLPAMQAWSVYIVNNGWRLKARDKGVVAPSLGISSITVDPANGNLLLITREIHNLANDDLISCYRIGATPKITGTLRVLVVGPDTLRIPRVNVGRLTWDGKGSIRKVVYRYPQITKFQEIGESTRKVGRPFGLLRGRQSPRTRRYRSIRVGL